MNIPVVQGGINMDGLLKWLQGNESFLQVKAGRSIYTYMRIPVEDGADYIYEQDSKGSWIPYFRDSFRFGGVYIRKENRLYCCNNIIRDWRVSGLPESSCEDLKTLLKEFKAAVNERVADVVASDPKKYAARSLPGKAKEELSAYRKYIVYEDAINLLVASKKPEDVRFVRGYDPRDLFGTNVEAVDNDDYLNVYANYDLDAGEVMGYLDITLCRGDGVDIPMRCRLSDDERTMLLTKMRDYCQQCGTPLDEWREEYLAEREAEAASTVRKTTKQEGENKMGSREISLWIDERWADALEKHLPGHDLQKKMEEMLDGLTEQLPEQIRAEDERMEQEREAQRRFSALKVTEDGRDSFLISEGGMSLLNLSGCIRGYLNREMSAPFASTLYRARECDVTEFKSALAERADNTGRVIGVFMVDVDAETLSTLDECGGWHEYKFHDLSVAAYAANRKTQQRQERRQEIFAEKLSGKELTPLAETHAPAPMMGQTM